MHYDILEYCLLVIIKYNNIEQMIMYTGHLYYIDYIYILLSVIQSYGH